jgi:hypothetical protein
MNYLVIPDAMVNEIEDLVKDGNKNCLTRWSLSA